MKFNKIILICLLLAIVSFGAVSAVDDGNLTVETSDVSDDLQATDNENLQNNDESPSIVITDKTFNDYFDVEGRISDSVPEGSILDFQGQINASDNIKAIYINKPVNIISSTKDASITLNTVNGTMGKENISNRFIIDGVSSITISDVIFNRTQMIIYNSSNVILNNVKIISDDYRIIDGKGARIAETSPLVKFENINGFTLNNSYIYVYNLGSRLMDCRNVKDAMFDSNIFLIRAESLDIDKRTEQIIFFSDADECPVDSSLTFTNNHFDVNYTSFSGVTILANNILFENNTYEHSDITSLSSAIGVGLIGYNVIARNNRCPVLNVFGGGVIYDNSIKYSFLGSGSHLLYNVTLLKQGIEKYVLVNGSLLIYNNTIGSNVGHVKIGSNSNFYNGTINCSLTIDGNNVILKDSRMHSLVIKKGMKNITVKNNYITGENHRLFTAIDIESTETYIDNNVIKGNIIIESPGNCEISNNNINGTIKIESSSSIIEYNIINAFDSDYAVSIKADKKYINNEISDNRIYSRLYCGDRAVSYDENILNFVEYNTPSTQIGMLVNSTAGVFDYGVNTTIIVNMPDVKGNVTLEVGSEKYVVGLVNGVASHVLTKYSLGFNKVTVIYYDALNDVGAIGQTNFTVNKVTHCPVELVYGELFECEPSTISLILPDDAQGIISVSLTNGIYTVNIEQNASGRNNKIKLPGLFEGDYTISATFTSVKYVTNSSEGIISFVQIPVYKLTGGNVVMDYNDGFKYTVLVTKDGKPALGETVKITLNGKTSNVKTDKNGYATLKIANLPGKYTVTATYKGQSVKNTIHVKQNLKASRVTVKKSAKSFVLKATLSKVKGKTLTFKFNGKTYTAKTDKKGVAKVTIKKNIIKKLKKGKKYTFTVKYISNTVKSQVTVK